MLKFVNLTSTGEERYLPLRVKLEQYSNFLSELSPFLVAIRSVGLDCAESCFDANRTKQYIVLKSSYLSSEKWNV